MCRNTLDLIKSSPHAWSTPVRLALVSMAIWPSDCLNVVQLLSHRNSSLRERESETSQRRMGLILSQNSRLQGLSGWLLACKSKQSKPLQQTKRRRRGRAKAMRICFNDTCFRSPLLSLLSPPFAFHFSIPILPPTFCFLQVMHTPR